MCEGVGVCEGGSEGERERPRERVRAMSGGLGAKLKSQEEEMG